MESGCREQLAEVALPDAGQIRLVADAGVELASGAPERAQGAKAAGVIPDARGDHAAGRGHAPHLADPADRIGHEVDD